jgi:hypothetical protein
MVNVNQLLLGRIMAKIFFAYPYAWDHDQPHYRIAIKEATRALGHQAIIAKDIPTDLPLLEHIKQQIEDAEIAFFDITGLNPNVLIEFGIGYSVDTKAILLVNPALHVRTEKGVFGAQRIAMTTPTDLSPFVRYDYADTNALRVLIAAAIRTHLPEETRALDMRDKIKKIVAQSGPINMSAIAAASRIPIDDVRPILKGLVALNEINRLGAGPGTKYQVPRGRA